jgi:glycosyltransferase involved in cell wall biosynthesis
MNDRGISPDEILVNVVQDGARLHYALPVALRRAGILGTVYTDWFVKPGSLEEGIARLVQQFLPNLGRRLNDRRCPELDESQVVLSNWLALNRELASFQLGAPEERYARLSRKVALWIGRQGWNGANAIMGFVRNIDPELCAAARAEGLVTVVDQMIAPAEVESAEADAQTRRWPGWGRRAPSANLDLLREIERRTWAAATHVTCPSSYVRDGLLRQSVAADKISVIPYPIDSAAFPFVDRGGRSGRPVVGFVGAVGLRKGAPTFFEVARRFHSSELNFTMVGPVEFDRRMADIHNGRVELTGRVPRSYIHKWLEGFDIFFFPSTCEGSAGAVMEAMATGLPIVTSPNSGTLVRDGVEGFVRAHDDIGGFTQSLKRLRDDPELRAQMGRAAWKRAQTYDLASYSRSLHSLFQDLKAPQPATSPARYAVKPFRAVSKRNGVQATSMMPSRYDQPKPET